jgi:hypothetical protein
LNPSLRTSAEVRELLDVPVLALVSTGDGLDHANEPSSPNRIEPLS